MQQRRLRLGDILDDYCPRERRITNHVVVAMIDEQVKQTRCTTCDADHEYKQARVPASRRRKTADLTEDVPRAVLTAAEPSVAEAIAVDDEPLMASDQLDATEPLEDAATVADVIADDIEEPSLQGDDEGPVHRPLIRATLPRPEGQAPEWREPEFTARYPGRSGRETDGNRVGGQGGPGHPNANRGNSRGPSRGGEPRGGPGRKRGR